MKKDNRDSPTARSIPPPLEAALREKVRADERAFSASAREMDSLWDHLLRVAAIAERLGCNEGLDPAACRMAGLFHDAGKFSGGRYHEDDCPEEEKSVEVLRELGAAHEVAPALIREAATAITQLYRDDPELTPLARVLFDADNLDKLGLLGVANFFVKTGLRGRGISREALHQLTVELTYAFHASEILMTASGRALAEKRALETRDFYTRFLDTLREDGLYDFRIEETVFEGIRLLVVAPRTCGCSGKPARTIRSEKGVKCTEIHLEHRCPACGKALHLRFCKPRLAP